MGTGTTLAKFTVLAALGGLFAAPQTLDVASIKVSRDTAADSNVDSVGGRLTATAITVKELIRLAYGVRDYQIARAPAWVDNQRFDIAAKRIGGKGTGLEDLKSLVRELLATRFQLTTHSEAKQMPVYLLVAAKGGPKLTPHNDAGPKTRGGCGRLVGRRVTVDYFAAMVSRQLDREVVNRTGLPGEFDVLLDFTPDAGPCRAPGDSQADPSSLPSIYTALQEQLGLKLEPSKGPVDILVIDRLEKPSEN